MPKKVNRISKEFLAQRGRPSEVTDTMVRFWDGLPVFDAHFDLVVRLEGVDYRHAKARDFFECAFVQAVRRMYNSEHAMFCKSLAYVDLDMNGDGERKVYRFYLNLAARRIIAHFDKTTTIEERAALAEMAGANFILRAPKAGSTLNSKLKSNRASRTRKRTIVIGGVATCGVTTAATKKAKEKQEKAAKAKRQAVIQGLRKRGSSILEFADVRNAQGLVQFRVGKVHPSKLKEASKHLVSNG